MSRKRRTSAPPKRAGQRAPAKAPWWNRPAVWVGGLVSALALGMVGAFGSSLGQDLFSTAVGQHSAAPDRASPAAPPLPVTSTSTTGVDILSSTFFEPGVDTFFVTKNTFQPTGQVAATLVNAPSSAYLSVFRNVDAVNQAKTVLRFVFTGESRQGVRILNITPIVLKRRAPWHGDLFEFPLQGEPPAVQTSLNLDDTFPTVTDGVTGRPYFAEKTITLQLGEQEVVLMSVSASRGFVAYDLRVDYLVGSHERHVVINDHGQPFKLSAVNCVHKNFESYGLVLAGRVANLRDARLPSHFEATCLPN